MKNLIKDIVYSPLFALVLLLGIVANGAIYLMNLIHKDEEEHE